MRIPYRQSSFGAGEFAPKAFGRTDLPQYRAGCAKCRRWLISPEGSAHRMPGFKYLKTCKTVTFPGATERSSSTGAFGLWGICYAAEIGTFGRWVAVGDSDGTEPVIVYSDDHGATWTRAGSVPNENETAFGVCWSGSSFVLVGTTDATDAMIMTSPDGNTWTSRASGTSVKHLNAVCWTGSAFVAVGDDGSAVYSATGATWSAGTGLSAADDYYAIAFQEGVLLTASTTNITTASVSVDNGATWANAASPGIFVGRHGIFYSGGYWYFGGTTAGTLARITRTENPGVAATTVFTSATATTVAVGGCATGNRLIFVESQNGRFFYSADGASWTESNIEAVGLNQAAASSRNLVIVGDDDATDAQVFTLPLDTGNRRLEPFIGSTGTPYMLEFGHLYLRFLRPIGFASDSLVNYVESAPGTPLELTTPYDANDLADVQVVQANDVMYLFHPSYQPCKLSRTGEATFTLVGLMNATGNFLGETTALAVEASRSASTYRLWDGPYLDENSTVATLTLGSITPGAGVSLTLSSAAAINNGQGFQSTDIGRAVRFTVNSTPYNWGWGIITARTSTTVVTIFLVRAPTATTATTRWALGAWSETTGFPRAAAFYQQRLCTAGTRREPMRLWASVTADFERYSPTDYLDEALDDHAVYLTIASRRMLPIQWLEPGLDLYAGTKGGVWRIDGGQGQNEITPGALRVRLASSYGAEAGVEPVMVGDVLIYVQQGGRKLRGVAATQASDVLAAPDLALTASHITESGLVEVRFGSTPWSTVWGRRDDGLLVGMTLEQTTGVLAWHQHQLAGSLTGADFPAVLSLAVLPIAQHDQLWIVSRRTVNGAQVEFVETMQLPFDSGAMDQADAWYVDAGVKYDGVSTTSITGLSHLEGASVYAWADGIQQGPYTVGSGAITLDTAASTAVVGLDYSSVSDLETLPVRVEQAANARYKVGAVLVELLDTCGLQFGPSQSALVSKTTGNGQEQIAPETYSSGAITPLTGDREWGLNDSSETRTTACIRAHGLHPAAVTGLTHLVEFDHV